MPCIRIAALLAAASALGLPDAGRADPAPSAIAAAAFVSFDKTSSGRFYIQADGSWRWIGLPRFELGLTNRSATVGNLGPGQSYDVRPQGLGVSGAVGHVFPSGSLPAWVGSNARLEIGGSVAQAEERRGQSAQSTGPMGWAMVNRSPFFLCPGAGCSISSKLATDYDAWQVNAKLAGDHTLGRITLTPSLTVFGGKASTDHDFTQSLGRDPVGGPVTDIYTANAKIDWYDVGAKLGLETRLAVTSAMTVGLAGTVGAAYRKAALTANDQLINGFTNAISSSSLSLNAERAAFVAEAKAIVAAQPRPGVEVSGFAGAAYDSQVPGIGAPSYTASGTIGIPATITFEPRFSYFAGGQVAAKLP